MDAFVGDLGSRHDVAPCNDTYIRDSCKDVCRHLSWYAACVAISTGERPHEDSRKANKRVGLAWGHVQGYVSTQTKAGSSM